MDHREGTFSCLRKILSENENLRFVQRDSSGPEEFGEVGGEPSPLYHSDQLSDGCKATAISGKPRGAAMSSSLGAAPHCCVWFQANQDHLRALLFRLSQP